MQSTVNSSSNIFQTYRSIYNERSIIESSVLRSLHYERHWCNHPEHQKLLKIEKESKTFYDHKIDIFLLSQINYL